MKSILHYIILSVFTIFLLTGCFLKSVHPLVSVNDAILLDGLEGRWEDDENRWTFIHDTRNFEDLNNEMQFEYNNDNTEGTISFEESGEMEGNSYLVILEEFSGSRIDSSFFFGHIGSFGGNFFMDLELIDASVTTSFANSHLFPVHTFSKLRILDSELSIEFFKDSWIKELIENNRIRIKHEKVSNSTSDDEILITASTEELQKFVIKYSNDEKAFDDPKILARSKNAL